MKDDPYQILGVSPGDDEAAIRRRYLEMVRLHPPDRDAERFAAIRDAYEVLRDPAVRIQRLVFGHAQGAESVEAVRLDAIRQLRAARIPTRNLLALADQN